MIFKKKAIDETQKLLSKTNFDNVVYHLSSHEFLIEDDFDLIIYNLGYLPGSDKKVTTKANATLNSIKKALSIINLKKDFLIIIVIYPGHHEGLIESKLIDAFSYQLPSNLYLVCRYQNYNRPFSPYIITISKNKL